MAREIVDEHRQAIEAAIVDGLSAPRQADRLKAAELALKLGLAAERLDATVDRDEGFQMDRAALLDVLAQKFTAGPMAGLLRDRLAVIDAKAADVPRSPEPY